MAAGRAVDRGGDHEQPAVMRIEHAALVIGHPRLRAERAEDRIVERLRRRDIIGADHHMAEHRFPPLQYITTLRMLSPACIRSKPLLISSRLSTWVIIGSISMRPFIYQSTIFGTSVPPPSPPTAVPFQDRKRVV